MNISFGVGGGGGLIRADATTVGYTFHIHWIKSWDDAGTASNSDDFQASCSSSAPSPRRALLHSGESRGRTELSEEPVEPGQ